MVNAWLHSRVYWFRLILEIQTDSCVVGLALKSLAYEKTFLKILYGFYLIRPFFLQKYYSNAPYKSWKHFFEIVCKGYQKKRKFALISKRCRLVLINRQKIFYRKTVFLETLAKKRFLGKKPQGTWRIHDTPFLNQRKLVLLKRFPLLTISKIWFFYAYKGLCYFFI